MKNFKSQFAGLSSRQKLAFSWLCLNGAVLGFLIVDFAAFYIAHS